MKEFNQVLFGIRLRTKFTILNHTTRTASKEIGISAPTMSRLIKNKTPDVYTYYKVCKWLKLDMNFFFEDYEG